MTKCKFTATVKKVSGNPPEEGGQATMAVTLTLAEPNRKALAALTKNADKALAALEQAGEAGGLIEIPCGDEACAFGMTVGNKRFEQLGTCFRRIKVDARGGELGMRIDVDIPKTADGWKAMGQVLGGEAEFDAVPQQATIGEDDEVPEKPAKAKAEKAKE